MTELRDVQHTVLQVLLLCVVAVCSPTCSNGQTCVNTDLTRNINSCSCLTQGGGTACQIGMCRGRRFLTQSGLFKHAARKITMSQTSLNKQQLLNEFLKKVCYYTETTPMYTVFRKKHIYYIYLLYIYIIHLYFLA